MKKFNLIVLFVGIQMALTAQLTLTVNMSFEPDPDVLNWAAHPETVQLTVTNTSDQTLEYKYLGRLTHNGQLVLDNDPAKMSTETIGPFETRISFAEDIFPSDAVEIHGNSAETYLKTNTIPGGQYLICIKLINLTGQDLSPDNCKPFQITRYTQPSLIFPVATSPVTSVVRPIFSWSSVVPMPAFPVEYRLRVVEVPENTRSWVPTDEPGYYSSKWGSKEWMPKLLAIEESGGTITEYEAAVGVEIFYREDRAITGVWKQAKHIGDCKCRKCQVKLVHRSTSDQLSSDALRALNYGFPLIDIEVGNQTQYQWPMDMPDPLAGRSYVWSVQAFRSDNGLPIGDNEGLSQPAQFFVTEENANTNNQSVGAKAPDIIIADENGCLYGCTGNVWEPIDCPTERSFLSPDTYPFTFLLTSTEKGSEKKWFLVDETTVDEPLKKGPMLPTSRFTLANQVDDGSTRSGATSQYLDPKTAIITGGGGIKLCWTPQGCVIVEGDEACPDNTWNYLIEIVTTPNILQTTNSSNKQPSVTVEQIQPFLGEVVKAINPMYLSLGQNGELTSIKSIDECFGDYCLTLMGEKDISQTGKEGVYPNTRIWVCYLPEMDWRPSCICYLGWGEGNLEGYSGVWSGGPCYSQGASWIKAELPNLEDGTIAIRMPGGSTKCLMTDGSYGQCNGVLPSIGELVDAYERANVQSNLTDTLPKAKILNFYLHDFYSDSGFVKFTPQMSQNANADGDIPYNSADLRYKDWSVIYLPNNTEDEKWIIKGPFDSQNRICITAHCGMDYGSDGGYNVTVSCYSSCTISGCCKLFDDWWKKNNISTSTTHGHAGLFDLNCLKCQKNTSDKKE